MTSIIKRPTVDEVVDALGPFPAEMILLGVADDGETMLLNTRMSPPNILVWNGEVSFLKSVAEFIMNFKGKEEIEFVVFTNNVEEWEFLANQTNRVKNSPCIGVIPFWSDLADQILLALSGWVHQGLKPNHSIIVLIEGMENILKLDASAKQDFYYVFLKGKDRRVFAVGTVPEGTNLYGLQDLFYQSKFNSESGMYEFPDGNNQIQVWIPRIGE